MSNWRTKNLTCSLIDVGSLPRESSSAKLNDSYWEMHAMDRRSLLQLSLASTLMGFAPSFAFADAATRPSVCVLAIPLGSLRQRLLPTSPCSFR